MESLALVVAIIVSPAMYGGPLALILTLWRSQSISRTRRIVISLFSTFAFLSGLFLVIQSVSRGATLIGFIGIATALAAAWRLRTLP